jgi:regulator of sigma E protease
MVHLQYDVVGDGIMVNSVTENSPAEMVGIKSEDVILKIGDKEIHKWEDVGNAINTNPESEKVILLCRNGENLSVELQPEYNDQDDRYVMGVYTCWGLVTNVVEDSPADQAGIESGDSILGINTDEIYSDQRISDVLSEYDPGSEVSILLLRNEKTISTDLKLSSGDDYQQIGVTNVWVSDTYVKEYRRSFGKAIWDGGAFIVKMPYLIKESIPFIVEDSSKAIVGPIGAGQLTVEMVQSFGLTNVIFLAGLVSIGIALFNFIPIPPLDGGGILVAFIEGVRRGKRLSQKTVRLVYTVGTAIIITIFVVVMYSDLARLISGGGFL